MKKQIPIFTSILGSKAGKARWLSASEYPLAGADRRSFLKLLSGIGATTLISQKLALARPLESRDFARLIPPNKHLSSRLV